MKRYTKEFRESVVKLITEQGYQTAEVLGISVLIQTMLGRWKREIEEVVLVPRFSKCKRHTG